MSEPPARLLLLTGRPGVGKTTVIRRVVGKIAEPVAGFYTEEIRDEEGRKGFRIVDFDGREAVLAHVDRAGEPRVSKYGVDVEAVDRVVERMPEPGSGAIDDTPPGGKIDEAGGASMTRSAGPRLLVVDEIGKMECYSERFTAWIRDILASEARLLATVARRGGGLIAEVKKHSHAEVRKVTRHNRDRMPKRILEWLGRE